MIQRIMCYLFCSVSCCGYFSIVLEKKTFFFSRHCGYHKARWLTLQNLCQLQLPESSSVKAPNSKTEAKSAPSASVRCLLFILNGSDACTLINARPSWISRMFYRWLSSVLFNLSIFTVYFSPVWIMKIKHFERSVFLKALWHDITERFHFKLWFPLELIHKKVQ